MASGRISFQTKYRAAVERHKRSHYEQQRSRSNDDLLPKLENGGTNGTTRQRTRPYNWSSLGSLNSFGDSATTPPSSQEHTGSGGSHTGGSGASGPQRETLHSRFEFKQTLGKGTYGKVKLALDKRKNEQVAIKTIKKSRIENPHDLARIRREIDFMTSLNHPYIIKVKEVYESREKIILVMEYASGGELYDYLNRMKRIPESQARAIFRQIVSAVHFLHKNQIVHRDLKLENILIDHNGDIKLADFGLSNSWSPRRLLHTFCGSPLYASPEIVSGIPYYGPEVDCWSLGVLLYTLVYGSMPFQGGDYNRLVRNITAGDFIQPREQSGALGLIRSCLTVLPSKRLTVDDIAVHWWVNLGYKNPPVYYYLNTTTQHSGNIASPHSSTWPYSGAIKPSSLASELKSKPYPSAIPNYFDPSPHFPVSVPSTSVRNGHFTDIDTESKASISGYSHVIQTHRNSNKISNNNKTEPIFKFHQSSKRTPHDKHKSSAHSLIRYCLTPNASNRATSKDILRHDWLAHGPTLSVKLNSIGTTTTIPTTTTATSPPTDRRKSTHSDYEKVQLRVPTPTKIHDKSLSPTNSLLELELHTSSFFDTTKLRNNSNNNNTTTTNNNYNSSSTNREQQRRNRASAMPDSTRYYLSNNSKTNSSPSTSSRPPYRRPLSLSLDDHHSSSPIDYHYASTSEKPSQVTSPSPQPVPPTYTRRSRRTVSPTATTTKTTSTYGNNDRLNSPPATHRYTLATSPETTTRRTISPINPSRYLVSYDFDATLRDHKRKPIYKYTAPAVPSSTELNVVPSLLSSTTPVAPSVFTTSGIKFVPSTTRRMSPLRDQDTNMNTARLVNNTLSNLSSNIEDSINTANTTNYNNRRSLLTSYDLPSSTNNLRKNRYIDDNNNLISLKVHE
ncbi:unnamed protein product [Adineta steineri]|uniref:Protein kinase domain-containing protein n=1 Tax=Adineta steineri TaxID=433720 RepID=A0A819B1T9_9BILA|nr:unnamed protein product [Adineta steineri]